MNVPIRPLGSLAEISTGGTPERIKTAYWGGEIPWITTGDIDYKVIHKSSEKITKLGLSESAAKVLPKGTIVMAMYGQGATRGKVAILGIDAATNQACAAIVPKREKIDPNYLYCVLAYKYKEIRELGHGGNQKNLNFSLIREIPIPVPLLSRQREIAAIAQIWDAAIKDTERLVVLRAKQREWLLSQVALFSNHKGKLGDFLVQVNRPVPRPATSYWALGIRSHGKGTFQRFVEDPTTVDMEELYEVKRDDLIINITFAWEGAIASVKLEDEHCLVSHRFPTYEVNRNLADPRFVKYIVNRKSFFSQLALISPGGAGRNRVLNKKDFLKLTVPLPPLGEQKRLATILETLDQFIEKQTAQLTAIKNQKRGLMQKLLTGKWRLKLSESAPA